MPVMLRSTLCVPVTNDRLPKGRPTCNGQVCTWRKVFYKRAIEVIRTDIALCVIFDSSGIEGEVFLGGFRSAKAQVFFICGLKEWLVELS